MSCTCEQRREEAATAESAEAVSVLLDIRGAGHPLACRDCLEKHLAKAVEQAREYAEDGSRRAERLCCIGNLGCAEDHAVALGLGALAESIRAARRAFQGGDAAAPLALREIYLSTPDNRNQQET